MLAPALEFDAATHRYSVLGRPLISVTQALTEAGFIDTRWFTEESAQRGTFVHQAILLHHEGDLDEDDLDPVLVPYYRAYRQFLADSGFVVQGCEERLFDEVAGYAGTLDLRGQFPTDTIGTNLIDVKSGAIPNHVGRQVAGYKRLLRSLVPVSRWCLNVRADATYRLEPLRNRNDERVFLAAVTVAQAKRGWL